MQHQYLETARRAARLAGRLIRERFPQGGAGSALKIAHKGTIDLVTEVDIQSEKLLRQAILDDFPQHAILGEEEGQQGQSQAPLWIVDPLDGTRSFAHGYPFVSVSVALEVDGILEVGVVYDPLRDELFEANRGQGARLNGRPIHCSPTGDLGQALLASGFPYHLAEFDNCQFFQLLRDYILASGGFRRDGSAALDFCYIACGRLDGYWEFFLKPWDGAAGALIAQEAGALVTNLSGDPFQIRKAEVLACTPHIHPAMVAIARPYLEDMRSLLI